MSDSDKPSINNATVGVKADVSTIKQLSSSGKAAQDKRNQNLYQKSMANLSDTARNQMSSSGKAAQEKRENNYVEKTMNKLGEAAMRADRGNN